MPTPGPGPYTTSVVTTFPLPPSIVMPVPSWAVPIWSRLSVTSEESVTGP